MSETIQLTIPRQWVQGLSLDQEQLRQALMRGLEQLRQQQVSDRVENDAALTLSQTGRVHRLIVAQTAALPEQRQPPPALEGQPVSEILIAQRRGE